MKTMQQPIMENAEDWTDEGLLNERRRTGGILEQMQQELYALDVELLRRMQDRGATSIPSERFTCTLEQTYDYDQSAFAPLKEVLKDSDLATCFTAVHEETVLVGDKWNTVRVLALARAYGKEAQAIVDQAKFPKPPKVKFGVRE